MRVVLSGRAIGVVLALSVVASACSSRATADPGEIAVAASPSTTVSAPDPTVANAPAEPPVAPTTTVAAEPEVASATTTPTDPNETFVANIVPDVTVLDAYDSPNGLPVTFEYPITNPTYFDHPLSLMIVDRSDDGSWLKVQIPVRPNGTEAWIKAGDAAITSHHFHAEVNVSSRSVTVWNGDEVVAQTGAVVGADRSPTPLGHFFINDLVEKYDGSAYGPYILSLSAFSEALDSFGGGVPVIAIHGTNNPSLIGGAHSNGCIRIPNEVVRVLAETVPMGTPVDIVA